MSGASASPVSFPAFDSLVSGGTIDRRQRYFWRLPASALVAALGGLVAVLREVTFDCEALILIAGAAFADMGSGESGVAFVVGFLFTLLKLYIIWWIILKIIRFNLLAYFLLVAALSLLNAGTSADRSAEYVFAQQRSDRAGRAGAAAFVAACGCGCAEPVDAASLPTSS